MKRSPLGARRERLWRIYSGKWWARGRVRLAELANAGMYAQLPELGDRHGFADAPRRPCYRATRTR